MYQHEILHIFYHDLREFVRKGLRIGLVELKRLQEKAKTARGK